MPYPLTRPIKTAATFTYIRSPLGGDTTEKVKKPPPKKKG